MFTDALTPHSASDSYGCVVETQDYEDVQDGWSDEIDEDMLLSIGENLFNETVGTFRTLSLLENSVIFDFTESISQNSIGGRNGSTACAVISLLFGSTVCKRENFTYADLRKLGIGAMEIGNILLEENNISGLLDYEEALQLLPENIVLEAISEGNLILDGDENAHLRDFLNSTCLDEFLVIFFNDKAFSIIKKIGQFIAFDSHAFHHDGARLMIVEDADIICQSFFRHPINPETLAYIVTVKISESP